MGLMRRRRRTRRRKGSPQVENGFSSGSSTGGGAKIAQHFNTVSPFYSTTAMRRGCSCLERLSSPPPALAVPGSDAEAIERWCGGGMVVAEAVHGCACPLIACGKSNRCVVTM